MTPKPLHRHTTRPTARVLALLEILQTGGTYTVVVLAARLGVDERTVRRYISHLTDLDVPVRSVRGRYGGYRLGPGYRLPPLMFTDDEAVAVLLGLTISRRAGSPVASTSAADSGMAKLRRVLPLALATRLDAVLETVRVSGAPPAAASNAGVLLVVAEAHRGRRPLAFTYTARDGLPSDRTLHPYGIVAHAGRWYVIGEDSASGEVRTFRLDRMEHLWSRPGRFDVPDGFDPVERVLAGIALTPWRHDVSLRVHGRPEQVLTAFPARIAIVEPLATEDGWVRVRLHAERLDWVPALLAGLPFPFVVDGPDVLRQLVRDVGARLTTAAT